MKPIFPSFRTRVKWASKLVLLYIGASAWTSAAMAQSAGTFTPTGSMTVPRYFQYPVLLDDGRVYIAGGDSSATGDLADSVSAVTAEIYDPATGTFATTNKPPITFTPGIQLNDGRLLVIGRNGPGTAELYDPATGIYIRTGDMADPAYNSVTRLANGKVLFLDSEDDGLPGRSQVFDPSDGTFKKTGEMTTNRELYTATLLTNGKVLVTGGDEYLLRSGSAELYDPDTGSFSLTGYMSRWREGHTATLLSDGKVLFTGGHNWVKAYNGGLNTDNTAEVYDPATGTFSPLLNMNASREWHAATLLNNGHVLITGGVEYWWAGAGSNRDGSDHPVLASAELYTPASATPPPALLSASGDGNGQGAILHANTPKLASTDDPALAGEALEIYCTGLLDGSVIPPQIMIGGRFARVLYFGNAPGLTGMNQVNVVVPSGIAPSNSVVVYMNYLGRVSNDVTIAVQ